MPSVIKRLLICLVLLTASASSRGGDTAESPVLGQPWKLPLPNGATLEMVWIPPGVFTIGSPDSETLRRADEGPEMQVMISRGFWLGKTMVTIGQWKSVMGLGVRAQLDKMLQDDTLYDLGGQRQTRREFMRFSRAQEARYLAGESDDLPVYFVSWLDAMEFCEKLNQIGRASGTLPAGYAFNLPTEAQWEYAGRAGTTGPTYSGEALGHIAWFNANSPNGYTGKGFNVSGRTGGPHPVAQLEPNAWGLYDMLGNVWQWCRDWYGPYPGGSALDPTGPAFGEFRVNRGGSFGSAVRDERCANRAKNPPPEASAYRGFRLALCPSP
jgi:formylglycine-generating enzyme required for sulfatase activity